MQHVITSTYLWTRTETCVATRTRLTYICFHYVSRTLRHSSDPLALIEIYLVKILPELTKRRRALAPVALLSPAA